MIKTPDYRSLIVINTFERIAFLKLFLPDYINFCLDNSCFDLVVSLDGADRQCIDYCDANKIPLIYSDKREGVGIAKNRVLERFSDYDYYFFIDDDVELMDSRIFKEHVSLSKRFSIHHFSSGEMKRFVGEARRQYIDGYKLHFSNYGSGAFSFFTKYGLEKVGGWHIDFAKYRRWGHTEHTHRFFSNELSFAPFIVAEDFAKGYLRWHNPPASSSIESSLNQFLIPDFEQNLIDKKLKNFPVKTISKYYHNGHDPSLKNMISQRSGSMSMPVFQKILKTKSMEDCEKANLLEYLAKIFYKSVNIKYVPSAICQLKYMPNYEFKKKMAMEIFSNSIKLIIKRLILFIKNGIKYFNMIIL